MPDEIKFFRSTYSPPIPMATRTYSLETAYALTIGDSFKTLENDPDVIDQLLKDTRSEGTRQAYAKDLRDFFRDSTGKEPNRDLVFEFLHLEQRQAVAIVLKFKGECIVNVS
jgi:integrase/recombinase XerC